MTAEPIHSLSRPTITPMEEDVRVILDFLILGGPVVWILALFSLFAVTLVMIKQLQFWRLKPEHYQTIDTALVIWQRGEQQQALRALEQQQQKTASPLIRLFLLAMTGCYQQQPIELLREELARQAEHYLYQLRSFLRPLELIAALSPLLGLLGTVLGMIGAFQQMEAAGNQVDPSVLSGGIWQALLTTAVGLAVAIPALILHTALDRKAERVSAQLQQRLTLVFTAPLLQPPREVVSGD